MSSFVTIKIPKHYKSKKFINLDSKVISLRMNCYERELLKDICNKLDIKPSTLIKYCVIEFCKSIKDEERNAI